MFVESARPRAVREYSKAGWLAVATVCFGAFMGQLDASIVTSIFPSLQGEFGAPLAGVQWVSLAYLLTLVGLVVAAGRVADAAGRKLVYVQGFAVFTAASAACALAPDLRWLIGFRVLQAVGAAMLQANSVALVVTSVPAHTVRSALGVQAGAQAMGLALGPALGGLFVASVGWRWVFWLNVPVGCLALLAGRYLLPRTREHAEPSEFDWPGLAVLIGCTSALLLALSGLSGLPLPAWTIAGCFGMSALCAAGLVWRESRAPAPLIDLTLLRPRAVSFGLIGALAAYLVLFGPLTLYPQIFHGHGVAGGLVLAALPAGFAVAATTAQRLLPTGLSTRAAQRGGAVTAVVSAGSLAVAPDTPLWVAVWLALLGLGLGVFIPSNNTAIMSAFPVGNAAIGGGLVNMSRGVGTSLGVAVVTLSLHYAHNARTPADAARVALAGLAIFAIAAAVTASHQPDGAPDSARRSIR